MKVGIAVIVNFLFMLLLAESITRSHDFQDLMTPADWSSRHYQLGPKLWLLDSRFRSTETIDCLFVGNSMVDLGIDPASFSQAYEEIVGQPISCFNFGIDALPAVGAGALTRVLVEDYQPRLLIYGTDARDYVIGSDMEDAAVILDSKWIKYRLGDFSIHGWLVEHSSLFRYRYHLARLLRFNLNDFKGIQLNHPMNPYGQTPYTTINFDVDQPPSLDEDSSQVDYYSDLLTDYDILSENLDGLRQITELQKHGIQILVVEMPIPDGYFYFFGNGREDYQRFIDTVGRVSRENDVPFLQTSSRELIPDDGWVDYSHLNIRGADVFSRWLGQQIGKQLSQ